MQSVDQSNTNCDQSNPRGGDRNIGHQIFGTRTLVTEIWLQVKSLQGKLVTRNFVTRKYWDKENWLQRNLVTYIWIQEKLLRKNRHMGRMVTRNSGYQDKWLRGRISTNQFKNFKIIFLTK